MVEVAVVEQESTPLWRRHVGLMAVVAVVELTPL